MREKYHSPGAQLSASCFLLDKRIKYWVVVSFPHPFFGILATLVGHLKMSSTWTIFNSTHRATLLHSHLTSKTLNFFDVQLSSLLSLSRLTAQPFYYTLLHITQHVISCRSTASSQCNAASVLGHNKVKKWIWIEVLESSFHRQIYSYKITFHSNKENYHSYPVWKKITLLNKILRNLDFILLQCNTVELHRVEYEQTWMYFLWKNLI